MHAPYAYMPVHMHEHVLEVTRLPAWGYPAGGLVLSSLQIY